MFWVGGLEGRGKMLPWRSPLQIFREPIRLSISLVRVLVSLGVRGRISPDLDSSSPFTCNSEAICSSFCCFIALKYKENTVLSFPFSNFVFATSYFSPKTPKATNHPILSLPRSISPLSRLLRKSPMPNN